MVEVSICCSDYPDIFGNFFIASFSCGSARVLADRPKILSFNSYFDVIIDEEALNQDIDIDTSLNVTLEVRYWTDVPDNFLKFFPILVPSHRSYLQR